MTGGRQYRLPGHYGRASMVMIVDKGRDKESCYFVAHEFLDHTPVFIDDIGRNLIESVDQLAEIIRVHRLC